MLTYAHRNCYRCHGYARQAEYNATVSAKSVGAQVGDSLHWARYEKTTKENSLEAIQARVDKVSKLRRAMPSEWQRLAIDLSYDVDTLIAEVKRLRAQPTVTEDMVKRVARAMMEASPDSASITEDERAWYIRDARIAIDTVFGTGEEA